MYDLCLIIQQSKGLIDLFGFNPHHVIELNTYFFDDSNDYPQYSISSDDLNFNYHVADINIKIN